MKIEEYKNKIVLAELNPKYKYVMLVNRMLLPTADVVEIVKSHKGVLAVMTDDIDKTLKFVEIPHQHTKEKNEK